MDKEKLTNVADYLVNATIIAGDSITSVYLLKGLDEQYFLYYPLTETRSTELVSILTRAEAEQQYNLFPEKYADNYD